MNNKFKFVGVAILMAISCLTVGCNKKKQNEPSGGGDPIENDSELPTELVDFDEPSIQVHYQISGVKDESYKRWCLWMWSDGKEGGEYFFNYADDYGVIAYYPLSTFGDVRSVGFIIKQTFAYAGEGNWVKDDYGSDRFMDLDMITPDAKNSYHIYLRNKVGTIYADKENSKQVNAVSFCQFNSSTEIYVAGNNPISSAVIKKNGEELSPSKKSTLSGGKELKLTLSEKAKIFDAYQVEITFNDGMKCTKPVSILKLYDKDFDTTYNYDGELGALYTAESTTFKVWSPISKSIKLRIYNNGTPVAVDATKGNDQFTEYDMEKDAKGVFFKTLTGDQEGKYYTYFVVNSAYPEGKEVVDPYAKSAGVNGLRGMVVDFSKTDPVGWDNVDYLAYDRKELTIYETHIAELTCSDTWGGTPANAKLFNGFYESGTTYTKGSVTVKTGFDHIKELGVNAVQIIPFFDQANDETHMTFNWGYNPLNYNVVEGGYSSDPYDGYVRIRELKKLIQAYNEAGISIIMDVVYNHVNGLTGSNFDVLMPCYYFRYASNGSPSNGSGCGNETASDKYMFRKFMIESTCFWTEEYKLGGFRFDLMGIHDLETMDLLTAANKLINPNIVIHGEPWAGGTTAIPAGYTGATQAQAKNYKGYGQFNDQMRDEMLKSGMNPDYSRGWVTQNKWTVPANSILTGLQGQTGSATDDPDKTVNYATCHDNYTLHDRVVIADTSNSDTLPKDYLDEATAEKMNILANSLVFTSQGTTFMLAGEEMLRTKIVYDSDGNPVMATNKEGESLGVYKVTGNSYSSSYKTNEINYEWKVNHLDLFERYQALISLKQHASGLHNGKGQEKNKVSVAQNNSYITNEFKAGEYTFVCYYGSGALGGQNPSKTVSYDKPVIDTTGYQMYLDTLGNEFNPVSMTLQPFETLILFKLS